MPVICAVCHTENRDSAMFCHGCTRKLPAFVPNAPSLLETMRAQDEAAAARWSSRLASVLRRVVREPLFPLAAALLVSALTVGWYAQAMREPPLKAARATSVTSAAKPALVAPATAAVAPVKPQMPKLVEPVPLVASLAPGEIELSPGRAVTPAPAVASAAPAAAERRPPPRTATPSRLVAPDPRQGCEMLNFVFAARCEAAHCDKPEFAYHPRCNVVREERRREEARRNPAPGF